MHQCLQVPEILAMIFRSCLSRSPDGKRAGTLALASSASTCKAFYEPAIQILWEELPGLHVLLAQFPDCTFYHHDELKFFAFKAAHTITAIPISKILRHCLHVRKLEYDLDNRLHHSVLLALYNSLSQPKIIFPRLEEAVFPCMLERPMETILYPALMMSPRLQRISFISNSIYHRGDPSIDGPEALREAAHLAISRRLVSIASQLTTILPSNHLGAFPMGLKQYSYSPVIADLVPNLSSSFRSFDAGYIFVDIPSLEGLTRLPNLTTLTLTVQPPHLAAAINHRVHFTFPALTTLNITFTCYPMNPFFERIEAPALENLCIDAWDEREGVIILQGVHLNADGHEQTGVADIPVRYKLLKSLTIRVHEQVSPEHVNLGFSLQPSALQTFSALRHLESICIMPCTVDALSDEDIIDAFQAWPNLNKFALPDDPYWAGLSKTQLTLAGVRMALESCPNVSELVLPCDATQIPAFLMSPYPALRTWDFGNSPIDSGVDCAGWLQASYPNLNYILAFKEFRERIIFHPADEGVVPDHALEGAMAMDQWGDVCSRL